MRFYYKCSECGLEYDIKPGVYLCPSCSAGSDPARPLRGVLDTLFTGTPGRNCFREPFHFIRELLPVEDDYLPEIPVGKTPVWKPLNLRRELGMKNLYIKDDSLNPTGSLKDRASYLVAGFAAKYGLNDITVASTGNAASSMSGVGAAAGLNIRIFIPASAPKAKMVQSLQYGAEVNLVEGNYDLAFDKSIEYSEKYGGLNRNTAYNPLTIEGKKTVSLEIFIDIGCCPDYIFVPTGDGVILSGVYKGFADLLKLGLIDHMPVVYCVQAEGSNAIARALSKGDFEPPVPSKTIADSISVDTPRNGYHALKNLKKYGGRAVSVTDKEILSAQLKLSSSTGLFAEPSSAAAFAGLLKERSNLPDDAVAVVLITGSGLKDIDTAMKSVSDRNPS